MSTSNKKQSVGESEDRFTVRCPKSDGLIYRAYAKKKEVPVTTLFTDALDFYMEQDDNDFPPTIEQEAIYQMREELTLFRDDIARLTESVNRLSDAFYHMSQGDSLSYMDG